jgi:sec-independent protein translocase protein TatA
MGSVGLPEILLIALVALLLFGAGRIADIGKGLGQGIKNFKQGLKEADEVEAEKLPAQGGGAAVSKALPSGNAEASATPKKTEAETAAPR